LTTATATYTITPLALTVSATGVNKTYDTTTAATVTLSDNRTAGDVFTDSYASAAFADPNVGLGKPVNVSGINIAGADVSNYTFNTTAVTTANIVPPVSVNPNASAVPDSVLASLYSGDDQLPPPTLSGPTGGWRQSPGLPSSLPGVQPNSRTAGSESSGSQGQPQGQLSNQGAETIPSGAVRDLVTIINGGVRMSAKQGVSLRRISRR
jgi:YDG domain